MPDPTPPAAAPPAATGRMGWPRAVALGVVAGLMAGLFGVGGGIVLVPGLVLAGMAQHAAHATSLAAIVVTAPAALVPFAVQGEVAWPAAAALAAGAVLGAVGGADAMRRIPANRLRQAFGVLMLLVAARLLVPGGAGGAGGPGALDAGALGVLALIGLATGLLSALMGVGGGIVMVPAMVVLLGFGQHAAEGTSLAVIIPTAIAGAARHARNGYTDWAAGGLVGAGGVAGGLAGGSLAQLVAADVLQGAFAVLLVVAAIRLVRRRRAPSAP